MRRQVGPTPRPENALGMKDDDVEGTKAPQGVQNIQFLIAEELEIDRVGAAGF